MTIDVTAYDGGYFDGALHDISHNAGYSYYRANQVLEQAQDVIELLQLSPSDKILDVGCAKGFLVERLVDAGMDAYGLDVSDWAINSCNLPDTAPAARIRRPDLTDRFYLGNVLAGALDGFRRNEFDWLITTRTLNCFSDTELVTLASEFSRIARNQLHIVGYARPDYYTDYPLAEWKSRLEGQGITVVSNLEELRGS